MLAPPPRNCLLILSSSLLYLGCSTPQPTDPAEPDPTDGGWLSTGVGEPGAGDQGADETGGVYGTDTDDELGNGCLLEAQSGYFGYVHQCEGLYQAFIHENSALQEEWPIGADGFFGGAFDSYENPDVMACCDVYDPGSPNPPPQPHLVSCYYNLAYNICQGLYPHILSALDGTSGVDSLAAYVKSQAGQDACFAAISTELDSWDLNDPPLAEAGQLDVTWDMPEYGVINDPQFTVTALIWDVYIPGSSNDYIECASFNHNDGVSLLELDDSAEYTQLLDVGEASLAGPTYDQDPMSAELSFASDENTCLEPWCSHLNFSEEASDWTVHNLSLFSSTETEVTDGTTSVTVDWFRLELVTEVSATELATDKFQIPVGDALFTLSGTIEKDGHHLTAPNDTAITIKKVSGTWTMSAFDLVFRDSEGDNWTLTVDSSQWMDAE